MESFPRSLVPNRRPEVVSQRHEDAPLAHSILIGQVQRADSSKRRHGPVACSFFSVTRDVLLVTVQGSLALRGSAAAARSS